MQAPTPIDYAAFLANALPADVDALVALNTGDTIATPNESEVVDYDALGQRLWNAGLLLRYRVGREVRGADVWFTFDGILNPVAVAYITTACKERCAEVQTPPAE